LGNKQGAIADLQQAAKLFEQQGQQEPYQLTLELIRDIQSL
jgi:hypothetical protein